MFPCISNLPHPSSLPTNFIFCLKLHIFSFIGAPRHSRHLSFPNLLPKLYLSFQSYFSLVNLTFFPIPSASLFICIFSFQFLVCFYSVLLLFLSNPTTFVFFSTTSPPVIQSHILSIHPTFHFLSTSSYSSEPFLSFQIHLFHSHQNQLSSPSTSHFIFAPLNLTSSTSVSHLT